MRALERRKRPPREQEGVEPPWFRKPFQKILERDGSVTRVIHENPDAVQVSRLFTVPNDSVVVCPLIDRSELNSFVDTLRTRMKHLEVTTRLLEEPSVAAKVSASLQHLKIFTYLKRVIEKFLRKYSSG